MFIVELTYKKPLAKIEEHLEAHRSFLDKCLQEKILIVAGRKNPRTGGIMIFQLDSRDELEKLIQKDSFYIYDLAEYHIIDFTPTKYSNDFSVFIPLNT